MKKRIATLAALLIVPAVPAFAQLAATDSLGGLLAAQRPARIEPQELPATSRGCAERYSTLRARSEMKPSERRAAFRMCLAYVRAQQERTEVADTRE